MSTTKFRPQVRRFIEKPKPFRKATVHAMRYVRAFRIWQVRCANLSGWDFPGPGFMQDYSSSQTEVTCKNCLNFVDEEAP